MLAGIAGPPEPEQLAKDAVEAIQKHPLVERDGPLRARLVDDELVALDGGPRMEVVPARVHPHVVRLLVEENDDVGIDEIEVSF